MPRRNRGKLRLRMIKIRTRAASRNSGNPNNKLYHYCRNPRCGSKLKEPVENPHAAFCCRGCWEQYYRHRCVVCEKEIKRTVENNRICRRRKCRNELRKWPQVYLPPQFQRAKPDKSDISEPSSPSPLQQIETTQAGAKNPHEIRVQIGTRHLPSGWYWTEPERQEPEDVIERRFLYDRDGRLAVRIVQHGEGWWLAHPPITPEPPVEPLDAAVRRAEAIALWALPLDRATAKNMRAANRAAWRDRPADNLHRPPCATIERHHPPVNVLGGYKFPNAPVVDLSPLDMPGENPADPQGVQSRWKPSPTLRDFSDFPDIPTFLKRSALADAKSVISGSDTLPSPPVVPEQINEAAHREPPEVAEQPKPQIGDLPGAVP